MIHAHLAPGSRRVAADPRLALLRAWLSTGLLVLLLTPVSAWHSHSIGWLPYWCVVAPLLSLGLLRRDRVIAALAALLRGRNRRRRAFRAVPAR